MVVSLPRLPSCVGACDAVLAKVCKVLWKTLSVVEVANALLTGGAIFHSDRDPHFMYSSAFVP